MQVIGLICHQSLCITQKIGKYDVMREEVENSAMSTFASCKQTDMDKQLVQMVELFVALMAALIAFWQRNQKIEAKNETWQVMAIFGPKDETVTTPPEAVPARSWKMNNETRPWVLVGYNSTNKDTLLR